MTALIIVILTPRRGCAPPQEIWGISEDNHYDEEILVRFGGPLDLLELQRSNLVGNSNIKYRMTEILGEKK
ncbi:hypothetical protein BJ165DRAFT_35416 [Panaeolus papilionaceus]|nr:hypothetical protein BJ165DRAFT_35416 [Panaeolus papilionaceus]